MPSPLTRALLISIALLLGLVAALASGILARLGGASYTEAVTQGGTTFVMTTSVTVMLMQAAGLLGSP